MEQLFKQACWLHLSFTIDRYLMSNAHGHWDGAEKAQRHSDLCSFYVATYTGSKEIDHIRRDHDEAYRLVHRNTQALTDNLDTEIGFPLKEMPDYDQLAPLFFEKFHSIATRTLSDLKSKGSIHTVFGSPLGGE